jgi:hypothetical protein
MKMPNGKSAAMLWKDHIAVKLQEDSFTGSLTTLRHKTL